MRKDKKEGYQNPYLNMNVDDLLNESSSSDDSDKKVEVKKILKVSTIKKPVQEDHYAQDVEQIERELNMKYGISSTTTSAKKKLADSSDDSENQSPGRKFATLTAAQPQTNKQKIIDELCKSSDSSESSKDEKQISSDNFYKELDNGKKIQPKQGQKNQKSQNVNPPVVDKASSNYKNLNFDINKELEKQSISQNSHQDEKEQNFLQIVEKNEKNNEGIPESVQQANQLLSFDKQFYNNVKNKLMVYEDYPVIAKKLHQQDHKFYGQVSCIAMLKTFMFVGNSSGIIRVFDLKSQKEMKPLLDQALMKNDSPKVTCMDIAGGSDPQHPYGMLLSGYKNGSLALWDLIEYKLLKFIPNIHDSDVTNVKIYNVQNNGNNIHAISCEDAGPVIYLDINKKQFSLTGGYNVNSEYLFKTKLKGTTAIAIFQPNPSYPNLFCDNSCLLAVGGLNMISICTMAPTDCIYSVTKPSFVKEKAIPYIDWGFGLTPSHREKTVTMMAFAWDRIIQLIHINNEGTSLDIDGFYYSEKEVISLNFVGEGIIFAIFEGLDGREAKILYTTKFYPGSYKNIEENFNNKGDMLAEFERVAQVTMHAELEKSYEIIEIRSQVLHSYSQTNYNNSVSKHKQNILLLGQKTIQRGRLFSWKEYLEYIQYSQNYDWLSVLKVALEIYNGDIKGYAHVPDEKEMREEMLKGYMEDLIKTNIQQVLQKFKKKDLRASQMSRTSTLDSSQSEYQADQIAIKVAIEFCLNIGTTQFLFTQMLELFEVFNLRQKFISNLEQFIISGQFRKEHIPEDILSEFLTFYETKGIDVSLQERNLERIIQQLDLRNYTHMMRARLEILCESNCMVTALLAIQAAQNNKDYSIIMTMFKLMKKVGFRETKEEAKGIYPYVKKDIQMLFIVDSKKKYEIEKSKQYIGYKLLWIIKMFLEGRQFPYGSLQQSQYEQHVNQIANLLTDEQFLKEFLNFDSKCFFDVIQKLFYGDPFQFIAYKKSKDNYPLELIDNIQKMVDNFTKSYRDKIEEELEENGGYAVETELPPIMTQYYFFILSVTVEHYRYQEKLKIENELKKQKGIQVNQNRIELNLNFKIIHESINQVLINWSKQLEESSEKPSFDQSIIIEALQSQKHVFTLEHNDALLKQLDDLNLQKCLINIRIYLLESRGDYLQSFRLHMTDDQLKSKVFTWIRTRFDELMSTLDQEKRFNELKSIVASHMKEIIQVDVDKTIELIERYYDDSYSDQLILGELSQFPEVQFNFLTKFLHFNEVNIKIAIKDAKYIPERQEQANKYLKYLCLQVELMCKLQADNIGFVTPQILEKFVEQEHYPIDDCLDICKKYNQERAIAALMVRNNNFAGAIETYMQYMKKFSLVLLGSDLLEIIKDAQQREPKKKAVIAQIPKTDELIRQYGDLWDYEECYKHKYLSDFDETLQRACLLAHKSYENEGNEVGEASWFKVLLILDQWSSVASSKLQEEARKNPANCQILFSNKMGQDLARVGGLLSDFFMRRENAILMVQVPLSISPETLMEKLNLNLDAIRKIFEFKIKATKVEKKFIKIANHLIVQEILHTSESNLKIASNGYLLEGDSAKNRMFHQVRDICDNCQTDLIQYQKCPIRVFFGCSHTFHQHCITKIQKELAEQARQEGKENTPSAQCPKCLKDFLNITFEDKNDKKTSRQSMREQSMVLEKLEVNSVVNGQITETIYNYRMEQFDINMGEAMINSDYFTK